MSKHTPGPWVADDFCMEGDRRVRVGTTDGSETYYHQSTTICEAWVNFDNAEEFGDREIGVVEAEANARLIAASPDMKEALKGLLADMQEFFASTDHLEMALDLARRGKPLELTSDGGPDTVRQAHAAIAKAESK